MDNIRQLNYNEVFEIVKNSNPIETVTDLEGNGFWLFDKEIKKSPESYISEKSSWKPVYYGFFDTDGTCISMLCYTLNHIRTYENYPYILCIQSIKKGAGTKLLLYIGRKFKKEGFKGIALMALNDKVKKGYEKLGFKTYEQGVCSKMQLTFRNDVNDSIFEKEINENYISGSYGDPTFAVGSPNVHYNMGYMYSIKGLNSNLSGQKQNTFNNRIINLHVGSYISGLNKDGDRVEGRIYRIIKNSDGFITKVWIFSDNAKLVNVDINSIKSLPNGTHYKNFFNDNEKSTLTREFVAESIKLRGEETIVSLNGKKYIITLNEGEVVVGEINKGKIVSLNSIYEIDESFAEKLFQKINE